MSGTRDDLADRSRTGTRCKRVALAWQRSQIAMRRRDGACAVIVAREQALRSLNTTEDHAYQRPRSVHELAVYAALRRALASARCREVVGSDCALEQHELRRCVRELTAASLTMLLFRRERQRTSDLCRPAADAANDTSTQCVCCARRQEASESSTAPSPRREHSSAEQ